MYINNKLKRRYCTQKIHNLRKFLKLTQGKKRYQKKEITVDIINNIKYEFYVNYK